MGPVMPGPRRSILIARLADRPPRNPQTVILDALRTIIAGGDVPPGSAIPVDAVAAAFGVSRIPVREALETAGLRIAVGMATADDDEQARAAHAALDAAIAAYDARRYHRESRRFHLALIRPCRMRRLLQLLDTAWNMTEPLQPMSHLDGASRKRLHADHADMLAAFGDRDPDALIAVFAVHHHRLQDAISALPQDTGLFSSDLARPG